MDAIGRSGAGLIGCHGRDIDADCFLKFLKECVVCSPLNFIVFFTNQMVH